MLSENIFYDHDASVQGEVICEILYVGDIMIKKFYGESDFSKNGSRRYGLTEKNRDFGRFSLKNVFFINTRVVSILQKLWYLKFKVMGSNTLLWGMFMPIFKILPLKLRLRWYAIITLNFRLINKAMHFVCRHFLTSIQAYLL